MSILHSTPHIEFQQNAALVPAVVVRVISVLVVEEVIVPISVIEDVARIDEEEHQALGESVRYSQGALSLANRQDLALHRALLPDWQCSQFG